MEIFFCGSGGEVSGATGADGDVFAGTLAIPSWWEKFVTPEDGTWLAGGVLQCAKEHQALWEYKGDRGGKPGT